jgi:hypothetical protein
MRQFSAAALVPVNTSGVASDHTDELLKGGRVAAFTAMIALTKQQVTAGLYQEFSVSGRFPERGVPPQSRRYVLIAS